MNTILFCCPVHSCGWTHEWPNPYAAGLTWPQASVVAYEESRAREQVLRAHLESHDVSDYVRTIVRDRQRLGAHLTLAESALTGNDDGQSWTDVGMALAEVREGLDYIRANGTTRTGERTNR